MDRQTKSVSNIKPLLVLSQKVQANLQLRAAFSAPSEGAVVYHDSKYPTTFWDLTHLLSQVVWVKQTSKYIYDVQWKRCGYRPVCSTSACRSVIIVWPVIATYKQTIVQKYLASGVTISRSCRGRFVPPLKQFSKSFKSQIQSEVVEIAPISTVSSLAVPLRLASHDHVSLTGEVPPSPDVCVRVYHFALTVNRLSPSFNWSHFSRTIGGWLRGEIVVIVPWEETRKSRAQKEETDSNI